MNRRDFLRSAGGAAGATAAAGGAVAGPALAAEENGGGGSNETDGGDGGGGGGQPDFEGYLDDANGFDGSVVDMTGQDQASVSVGAGSEGVAFDPPAIHVDNGATVVWEWTGDGGAHNVEHRDGEFVSETVGEEGYTFEYTFEEDGVYNYFCNPHEDQGMKGGVVVGEDYPTTSTSEISADPAEMGVDIQEHFVGIGVIVATTISLLFAFFVLKYGESAHTKGGNN